MKMKKENEYEGRTERNDSQNREIVNIQNGWRWEEWRENKVQNVKKKKNEIESVGAKTEVRMTRGFQWMGFYAENEEKLFGRRAMKKTNKNLKRGKGR